MALTYRPDIDGMRALSIIAVVGYHCGLKAFRGGFVGVDVFFVISGYLIASLVYKEICQQRFKISRFYERRAKRILPALSAVLLFSFVVSAFLLSPQEMKEFGSSAFSVTLSTSNVYFWSRFGYFSVGTDLKPLLMTWSLGVEEQFYMICPLLLLVMRKLRPSRMIAIVVVAVMASFTLSVWVTAISPNAAFYLLPTRGWELGAGVLLALIDAHVVLTGWMHPRITDVVSVLGLGMIVVSVLLFSSSTPFPGYAAFLPVFGAATLIAARNGFINRLLALRPIVFVGLISYSWYLWHWPLLSFARISSDADIPQGTSLAIGACSFVIAVLSWKFIETPFRKSTTRTPVLLIRYAIVNGLLLSTGLCIRVCQGLPHRYVEAAKMEAAAEPLRTDRCIADFGNARPSSTEFCSPTGGGRAIALLGDSHAAALAFSLRDVASAQGYRFYELVKACCPPILQVVPDSIHYPGQEHECAQFNRESLRVILGNREISDVVLTSLWSGYLRSGTEESGFRLVPEAGTSTEPGMDSSTLLNYGLDQMIDRLVQAGKHVYLVQDNYAFGFDPMRHMRTRLISPRTMIARVIAPATLSMPDGVGPPLQDSGVVLAEKVIAGVAHRHPDVTLIDSRDEFCSPSGCRFSIGKSTLYIDSHHLSSGGAKMVVAKLRF